VCPPRFTYTLAHRYMEVGPERATLLQIGLSSLKDGSESTDLHSRPVKTRKDEVYYIDYINGLVSDIRGDSPVGFLVMVAASLCELGFYAVKMHRASRVDIIALTSFISTFFLAFVGASRSFSRAFQPNKIALTRDTEEERFSLTSINYLRLNGLAVLAKAQQRSRRNGTTIQPEHDLSVFRQRLVNASRYEAFTVHFIVGVAPTVISSVFSLVRSLKRGDTLLAYLAAGCVWSRLSLMLMLASGAFSVRLSQRLSDLEIKRGKILVSGVLGISGVLVHDLRSYVGGTVLPMVCKSQRTHETGQEAYGVRSAGPSGQPSL